MSKDMLGPITRALVSVPIEHHGIILDAVNKLGGANADTVRSRIASALRDEPLPPPAPLDTIVRVDRAARIVFPDWMEKVMHPELESTGSAEYDISTLQPWLHPKQMGGLARGQEIYDFLKDTNGLESCLGLSDGLAIQQMGIAVFRKFFAGKMMFLWKSVVQDRSGNLVVLYLMEYDDKVVVGWRWLFSDWDDDRPAARFAS